MNLESVIFLKVANSPRYMKKLFLAVVLLWPSITAAQGVLNNPLSKKGGSLSLIELVAQIVRGILGVSATLAAFFVIVGGLRIVFAAGNEDQVSQGKQTLLWAVLGLIVAFGGFIVLSALIERLPLLLGQ